MIESMDFTTIVLVSAWTSKKVLGPNDMLLTLLLSLICGGQNWMYNLQNENAGPLD